MNDEIKEAAEKYCYETGSLYFDYTEASNEIMQAFTAGANFANEKCQAQLAHHVFEIEKKNKVQEEEIKRLKEEMRLLHFNSRSNYISKEQAELVKQIRINYELN